MNRQTISILGIQGSILNRLGNSVAAMVLVTALNWPAALWAAEIPKVGELAPDFSLTALDGQSIKLSEVAAKGKVVLIVLRGWPGYQCPICDRQVQDLIKSKQEFAAAKAQLVFVYPGPADDLKAHAEEFKSWRGKEWPGEFLYALDPNYTMVNSYGLRWDAPRETAYPSTFVLAKDRTIKFSKISRSHGDRTTASEVLAELKKF